MREEILKIAAEIEPELISIRRDLHRHPELGLHEYRTAQVIADTLRKIPGVEVREHLAEGTGVAGILRGEKGPGKCVMLRADIDALPVTELVDSPWKSETPGQMHACGHDAHVTWVLGTAMIMSRLRDQFAGTVKFVFQPGEEIGAGAPALVEKDRILEDPAVDAVFAAHVWPSVRTGKIGIATKAAFGSASGFRLRIIGKGGHGSWPYKSINPITAAVHIYSALQNVVADKLDSTESRVISIGSIHAGEPGVGNIIPDYCDMAGTIRATDPAVVRKSLEEIQNVVEHITAMHHAKYELDLRKAGDPVVNDPALIRFAQRCADEVIGEGNCYLIDTNHLGGENFSAYSSRVPGCYLFMGIANDETEGLFDLHSPVFRIDESVLARSAAVFSNILDKYLNGQTI